MTKKHDRQGARTPADLERKYAFEKQFKEIRGVAEEAKKSYENLNQEQIFDKLTNNGQWEGFFYDANGNMYINASYIKSGVFLADLIKAGILQSVDGETFKLDLDKGIMTLKSGGEEIMHVDETGATLSGWKVNKSYLGTENYGMNGDSSVLGSSAKGGTSPIRFYAGVYNLVKKTASSFTNTDGSGFFEFSVLVSDIVSDSTISISSMKTLSGKIFTESDLDPIMPIAVERAELNRIIVRGKFGNAEAFNQKIDITIEYYAQEPAFQVLEDGTFISQYAVLGGYSIADIIARIEALEGK